MLMRSFTKNIGTNQVPMKTIENKAQIKKILICRPNARLGNLLLITPLIKEVNMVFPDAQIDLFVKGNLISVVLKNYPQIGEIIVLPKKPFKNLLGYMKVWMTIKSKKYDMAINVDKNSSSGRLAIEFSNADFKFYGDATDETEIKENDYAHIAKYPVYNFRAFLERLNLKSNASAVLPIDLNLSDQEIAQGKKILTTKFNNEKRTIAIFTYATAAKCYSEIWWTDFYKLLKEQYEQDFNILEILPVENVSQIRFKATSFYSTDIREIGAVIANTAIFIGADSGIMHLASAVHTPTIGLFCVSDMEKYKPYGANSIGIDTHTIMNINQYVLRINPILLGEEVSK